MSEVNKSSPPLPPVSHSRFDIDQVLFYSTASAIMEEYDIMRKKTIKNGLQSAIFDFIPAIFVLSYPCVRPYILFYIHGTDVLH